MVSYFYSWQNIVLAGDDNNDYFQSVEGGVCRGVEAWLFVFPWLRLNSIKIINYVYMCIILLTRIVISSRTHIIVH